MMDYPNKPRFYANRFVRLMAKACVAQDIGPEAFTLLTVVVMTEDARHYRSPVTFFNEQIAPMCGFVNVKALDRARKRAIESGWLQYQPGGKGVPGRYFVVIPETFEAADDAPSDEGFPPVCLVENDQRSGREVGKEAGEKRERSGQHSYLSRSLPLTPLPPEGGREGEEPTEFVEFANRYPKKSNRLEALAQWKSLKPSAELASTIFGAIATHQLHHPQWTRDNGRYVPKPDKWLRDRGWEWKPPASATAVQSAADILREMKRRREED